MMPGSVQGGHGPGRIHSGSNRVWPGAMLQPGGTYDGWVSLSRICSACAAVNSASSAAEAKNAEWVAGVSAVAASSGEHCEAGDMGEGTCRAGTTKGSIATCMCKWDAAQRHIAWTGRIGKGYGHCCINSNAVPEGVTHACALAVGSCPSLRACRGVRAWKCRVRGKVRA